MLEVTERAMKEFEAYFADKEASQIRIFLAPGGCSGPRLALALDDANENDDVHTIGNFEFIIDKKLYEDAQPLVVDLGGMGFAIQSNLQLEESSSSGGCSSCCGNCSC